MKKVLYLISTIAISTIFVSCNSNGFKVKGTAEGFADGDTLLVMSMESPTPLDTLIVEDGKFEWSGESDSTIMCSIVASNYMSMVGFFREPGTINVLLSTTKNSEVSGTKSNDALQEMMNMQSEYQKKFEALSAPLYADSVSQEAQMAVYSQFADIQSQMKEDFKNLAIKNLDNELGYMLITQMAYDDVFSKDEIVKHIKEMPASYQERQAIKDILRMLDTTFSTNEGDVIQDFKMTTPDGAEVSIMELLKQNKITVLDFWASWCQPCREEMPAMKQLLADNQEKGFGIIGISIDDNKEAWCNCITELELSWPQITDLNGWTSNIARSFGVRAIPFTTVVDQNGKVLAKNLRGEELSKFISEQLK